MVLFFILKLSLNVCTRSFYFYIIVLLTECIVKCNFYWVCFLIQFSMNLRDIVILFLQTVIFGNLLHGSDNICNIS